MNADQMRQSLNLMARAAELRKQLQTYRPISVPNEADRERLKIGVPGSSWGQNTLVRGEIPIPDVARSWVFRMWQRDTAYAFNAVVRELNQMGVSHDFDLIQFNRADGMPIIIKRDFQS